MADKENILVSICCTTYNHENYIRQCLDGFVMQKTNFSFEILVHEDASTDNTSKIVKEYETHYPDLFRCVYQTENQFLKQNTLVNILFRMARGKYIAMCEGDDYWTDPLKLQKQVDFLEANQDFAICFHKVEILNTLSNKTIISNKIQKSITTVKDLALGNYIYTASNVHRNRQKEIPKWFFECPVGDYPLHLLNAQYGKIKFMEDIMAVYRIHNQGIWGTKNYQFLFVKWDKMLEILSKEFEPQVNTILYKQKKKYLFSFLEKSLIRFDFKMTKYAYLRLHLSFVRFILNFMAYELNKFVILFKMLDTYLKR